MKQLFFLLIFMIGGITHAQQLKQIQKGTAKNQIPVTNGIQNTQVYRDAIPYLIDTLGLLDSVPAPKVKNSPTMTLRIQNDSIRADIKKRLNAGSAGGSDVFLSITYDSTGQITELNEIFSNDFDKSVTNELANLFYQSSVPTTGFKKGDIFYNTTNITTSVYDGSSWVEIDNGEITSSPLFGPNFFTLGWTHKDRTTLNTRFEGGSGIKINQGAAVGGNHAIFKVDSTWIGQIISDSLATITTEPDSIQRIGNVISLKDGLGSVSVADLVNVADSTGVLGGYGIDVSETANVFTVKADTSEVVTPFDLTLKQDKLPSFTAGSVIFSNGTTLAQDNSNFFWDDGNNELQIKGIPIGSKATNQFYAGAIAAAGATNANDANIIGSLAGYQATNASYSNIIGYFAGYQATNANNSNIVGPLAGYQASGAYESNFFGSSAGNGATNARTSNFFGAASGFQAANAINSNFFGSSSGYRASGAYNSNFCGNSAGFDATNAFSSNFFGDYSGYGAANASYSNFFGFDTGSPGIGANNIVIGKSITLPNATTNAMNIGGVLFGTGFNSGTKTSSPISGGKIGILNNSPQSTLHVSGDLRVDTRSGTAVNNAAFDSNGRLVEVSGLPTGTVTSIVASAPLTGGTITTSGSIGADTTSATGLATQHDLTSKQDKLSGANKRIPYFTGASTLSNSDNLVFDNSTQNLGIGISSPSATIHMNKATGNRIRFTDPNAGLNYKNWQIFAGSGSDERSLYFQSLSDAGSTYDFMTWRKAINSQVISNLYIPHLATTSNTEVMTMNNVGEVYRDALKTVNGSSLFGSGNINTENPLTFSSPLSRSGNTISLPAATTSVSGHLTSTDWNTFNSKFTLPSLTSGSVLFSNGTTIAQDNSWFFWDNVTKRLGLGSTSPSERLTINGNIRLSAFIIGGDGELLVGQNAGGYYLGNGNGINAVKPVYIGTTATTFVRMPYLAGSGTRMVTANASGDLSTAAIPTNTDNQTLSLTGGILSITGGNNVALPVLPSGSSTQTLRHNGSAYESTSLVTVSATGRMDVSNWSGSVNSSSKLLVNGGIQYNNSGFAATTLTGRDAQGGLTGVSIGNSIELVSGSINTKPQLSQTYTSVGATTWTKPAGARMVYVRLLGAGGGGAGGSKGATTGFIAGGGAGCGGGYSEFWFLASDLPTTLTVNVGDGGLGGAGATSSNGAGQSGSTGGNTTITNGADTWLAAFGGAGGVNINAPILNDIIGTGTEEDGGTGMYWTSGGIRVIPKKTKLSGQGGGAGGSINNNSADNSNLAQRTPSVYTLASNPLMVGGNGFAGGNASVSGNGSNGQGTGTGNTGGGGGGGGATTNTFTSAGSGSKGSRGAAHIITFF